MQLNTKTLPILLRRSALGQRCLRAGAGLLVLMLLVSSQAMGADKIRVAVLDFDTEALRANWRYGWHFTQLAGTASDALTHELTQEDTFSVIERRRLDEILREQNLGDSSIVDPSTAARLGKVLGVQLVVVGSVQEFGINEKGGRMRNRLTKWRGVGASVVTGKAMVTARLVDTSTAEILGSFEGTGTHRFGKGQFGGFSGGQTYDSGTSTKVLSEAIEQLAQQISDKARTLDPSAMRGGVEGKIARIDGGKIYLNVGDAAGVRVGDQFEVFDLGVAIVDPDTGEELGREESSIGTIKVVSLVGTKLAVAESASGSGFAVGNRVVLK